MVCDLACSYVTYRWSNSRGIEMRKRYGGKACPAEFSYTSNNNDQWLSLEELKYLAELYS